MSVEANMSAFGLAGDMGISPLLALDLIDAADNPPRRLTKRGRRIRAILRAEFCWREALK